MSHHSAHPSKKTEHRKNPPSPSHNDSHNSEIKKAIDDFARALTHGDAEAIAKQWQAPAFFLGDSFSRAVENAKEIGKFFASAKEQYTSRGIAEARAEIVKVEWLTSRLAMVEVRWPYIDHAGNSLGSETSSYALWRDDQGELKLRVALMHGVEAPSSEPRQTRH